MGNLPTDVVVAVELKGETIFLNEVLQALFVRSRLT